MHLLHASIGVQENIMYSMYAFFFLMINRISLKVLLTHNFMPLLLDLVDLCSYSSESRKI